jgi:hypothetical protein
MITGRSVQLFNLVVAPHLARLAWHRRNARLLSIRKERREASSIIIQGGGEFAEDGSSWFS